MVTRCRRLVFVLAALAVAVAVSCEKVPLLAPTGSSIILTTSTNVLSPNQSVEIVAQVLEASGSPPHSGTSVTFTTSLGTLEPATTSTDVNGRAVVKFLSGTSNGTATIGATSGGANTSTNGGLKISIGTAAVGAVRVNATPASVSSNGGSTTITANVLDINGNALASVPVVFSTTAGSLNTTLVTTDSSGIASAVLTTSQQATVTASVGALGGSSSGTGTTGTGTGSTGTGTTGTGTTGGTTSSGQASGTVTVTVNAVPALVITPPTTSPSAGIPAQFTFAVTLSATNGSAVRNLRVDWGDGTSQDLGAVTGNAVVAHTYTRTGNFTVAGTITDAAGNTATVSTAVNVIPVASPTVQITPSVPSSCTGTSACQVTFQLLVTPPTGVGILNVTVDFGPVATPPQQGLGGLTGSATLTARYPAGAGSQTVTVTVNDTLGRTTQGFTTIIVP